MYKMKSDINFSLTHEMLENAENERIHTSYAQEKAKAKNLSARTLRLISIPAL